MRDLIEKYVGPMILQPDGRITGRTPAPEEAGAGVKGSIAGAGFEPATFYE